MNDYNKAIAYFDEWLDCYYDIDDFPPDMTPEIASLALVALKARQRQQEQPNGSLTLNELRKMKGEPVWLHTFSSVQEKTNIAQRAILEAVSSKCAVFLRDGCNDRLIKWFTNYDKTWRAYRRKPEQEG